MNESIKKLLHKYCEQDIDNNRSILSENHFNQLSIELAELLDSSNISANRCETCCSWAFGKTDLFPYLDFNAPYCHMLRFYLGIENRPTRTPSDFCCSLHESKMVSCETKETP